MKSTTLRPWLVSLTLAVLVGLGAVYTLQGQPRPDPVPDTKKEKRVINTSGTATVRVRPDSARVFFGVQTLAPTLKAARTENAERVKKVVEALLALKIPDLKMKTSDVHVELVQTHRGEDRMPQIVGYRVTNTFTVLVKDGDVEQLNATASRVLDTALENGANIVQQIVFFKQETTDAKRQALVKAVEEAEANARAIARGANVTILDTIALSGQPEYHFGGRYQVMNNAQVAIGGEGADTPIHAGELEITCTVSVTCSY